MGKQNILNHQVRAIMPVNCVEFMMGFGFGWLAPILDRCSQPDAELKFTFEESSWIASLHYITRGLSPIFAACLLDKVGRNSIFIFAAAVNFGMWTAVLLSRDVVVHYVIRLIFGLSAGLHETATGIYIGENCSPDYRGTFNGIVVAFFYAAEIIVFLLPMYLSYNWVAIVYAVCGFVTLLIMTMLKEPAQHLIMKGKLEKAERNYDWLRDMKDPKTKNEFESIKRNVEEEKSRTFSLVLYRSPEVYRSTRIILTITFLSMLTGFAALNSFVTTALSEGNTTGFSADQLTVLFGVAQFVSVCGSSVIMDRFNRRTLMLLSCAFIITTHGVTAALYYVKTRYQTPSYLNILIFLMITTYSCVFGMFIFPLTAALRGELLPQSVKAIGSGLALFVSSVAGFLNSIVFLPISEAFGIEMNFVIYSLFGVLMFVYVYYDMPETKGKTLVQIQNDLKSIEDDDRAG